MCHDGGWVTLMGGLRKKWCQSWHCDGSLNSTLALKVFQVSKYAFLSWAYTRGPRRQFKKMHFNIHNRGKMWAHIVKQTTWSSGRKRLNPQSSLLKMHRQECWMDSLLSVQISAVSKEDLNRRVTIPHSIKGSTYGMPTQQNDVAVRRRQMLQKRLMSDLQCDY